MPERKVLGVCSGGFNGTNSSFGEDSSIRIKNIEDAANVLHPQFFSVNYIQHITTEKQMNQQYEDKNNQITYSNNLNSFF